MGRLMKRKIIDFISNLKFGHPVEIPPFTVVDTMLTDGSSDSEVHSWIC